MKSYINLASLFFASLVVVMTSSPVYAIPFTANTSDSQFDAGIDNQGWYSNSVPSSDGNDNYITGRLSNRTFRSFFTFDLSALSGSVTSATLELQRYNATGNQSIKTIGFFDVTTDAVTLNNNVGINLGIFNDLGTGTSYGAFPVSTTSILSFALNNAAIVDINTALGGFFSIGGSLLSGGSTNYIFGNSHGGGVQRLVLDIQPVPEPATLALMGLGLAGVGFKRRKALPPPDMPALPC